MQKKKIGGHFDKSIFYMVGAGYLTIQKKKSYLAEKMNK
jgi:hypothetical protein